MRKIILYTAVSLDHFIARPDGNIDWLNDPDYQIPDEDYGYKEFYDSIDTTLMGHNTYKSIAQMDVEFPYTDKDNYVFSRSGDHDDNEHVTYVSGAVDEFVRHLKEKDGADIWLVGGGQINSLLLNEGLIDQLILTIMPVTLGEGIPLFSDNPKEARFELESSKSYDNGVVQLIYNWKR